MTNDKKNSAWRSPWVFAWISLVVIVLVVNITMIMLSTNKNPGLVNDDFYERGQDYEENMAERLEKNLQWESEYQIDQPLVLNKPANITFQLKKTDGEFPKIDKVELYIYRPSDKNMDFKADMIQEDKHINKAQVSFPAKGIWDLLVAVRIGDEEFNFGKRVFVKEK